MDAPSPAGNASVGTRAAAAEPGADEPLLEHALHPDPIRQFERWLHDAVEAGFPEAGRMCLATAGQDGQPSARMVLLRGFAFFTNTRSEKARDLDENPHAALCFHWDRLSRQVRVEGPVERVSREETERYFASRSPGSRRAALISPQSQVVPDRDTLERWFADAHVAYPDDEAIPLPEHWGGYRVVPRAVEFWRSRSDRLHDRLRYVRDGSGWRLERLAP
jgi:pyridoxamine 5'-phosphate oxidase